MKFRVFSVLLVLAALPTIQAQDRSPDDQAHIQPRKKPKAANQDDQSKSKDDQAKQDEQAQPIGESSSADSKIVLGPSGKFSNSSDNSSNNAGPSDVNETYPFDPHRAAKDVEVG